MEVQTLRREGTGALAHLERHFFGENRPYDGQELPIRILAADNVFSEVEQAAAEIRRLTAAGKCRYRDITVAARNMADYEGTIETVFERYGIPVYLSRRTVLSSFQKEFTIFLGNGEQSAQISLDKIRLLL